MFRFYNHSSFLKLNILNDIDVTDEILSETNDLISTKILRLMSTKGDDNDAYAGEWV